MAPSKAQRKTQLKGKKPIHKKISRPNNQQSLDFSRTNLNHKPSELDPAGAHEGETTRTTVETNEEHTTVDQRDRNTTETLAEIHSATREQANITGNQSGTSRTTPERFLQVGLVGLHAWAKIRLTS